MNKLLISIHKEMTVLWRDKGGLAILFLMPMVLVLVVSLVQNNILTEMSGTRIRVLLLNHDTGQFGRQVETFLSSAPAILLHTNTDDPEHQVKKPEILEKEAFGDLKTGRYQFIIEIGADAGRLLEARCYSEVASVVSPAGSPQLSSGAVSKASGAIEGTADQSSGANAALDPITIYSAPLVQEVLRALLSQVLQRAVLAAEMQTRLAALSQVMSGGQNFMPEGLADWFRNPMLQVCEASVGSSGKMAVPNAVQQNVPAWTLFGIFFICVPLSGALIRERQEGILMRIATIPVSFFTVMGGKVMAYLMVCYVQAALMLFAGMVLLPVLGTPVLSLGHSLPALFLVVSCAALAAIGYGLLLGAAARSYEQASMFGAVSVVMAAALGGIMVPVYVMPSWMQPVSRLSPLSWGMDGFLALFVTGGGIKNITGSAGCLLMFAMISACMAVWWLRKKMRP